MGFTDSSLEVLCDLQGWKLYIYPKSRLSLLKQQNLSPLFPSMKTTSDSSAVKNIMVYYVNNWLVLTKITCSKKNKKLVL